MGIGGYYVTGISSWWKLRSFPITIWPQLLLRYPLRKEKYQKQSWRLSSGLGKELSSQDCLQFYTVGTPFQIFFLNTKKCPPSLQTLFFWLCNPPFWNGLLGMLWGKFTSLFHRIARGVLGCALSLQWNTWNVLPVNIRGGFSIRLSSGCDSSAWRCSLCFSMCLVGCLECCWMWGNVDIPVVG